MTYVETVNYIHSTRKLGAKLGLERIRKLLGYLGNPQEKLKVIHVAGTNGKGSTCAYIASILKEQGYIVGLFSSPAILRFNERIQINGEFISDEDLILYVQKVKDAIEKMLQDGEEHPTEFEIVTAVALLFYMHKETDFVVLEVGLGGRYDATNVVSNPILTVITNIGMDHMDFLGETIEEIAYEKSGILKEECPLVIYPQKQSVFSIIEKEAKSKNASIYKLDEVMYTRKKRKSDCQEFDFKYDKYRYEDIEISMLGSYQISNGANALLAICVLQEQGIPISKEAVYKGMKSTIWPGRFEILSKNPFVVIDGAHNLDGILALKESLIPYKEQKNIILLLGILKDKQYEMMIENICEIANQVIVYEVRGNPRALTKEELFLISKKYHGNVSILDNLENAFLQLLENMNEEDLLCCAGSLYFISDIKRLYEQEERMI